MASASARRLDYFDRCFLGKPYLGPMAWYSNGGCGIQDSGEPGRSASGPRRGFFVDARRISWQRVSDAVAATIENWFVAGSSPSEWEVLQHQAPNVRLTFIAISAYDLNEDFPCDYRANVVPLHQTINDLRQSHADWQFSKRILSPSIH